MDRVEIIETLTALAAELDRRGISGEMYVVGGAAIALAFDERRATRDIDAVFEPKNAIYEAAGAVAEQRGLPAGWLSDAVKGSRSSPIASERTRTTCACSRAISASNARRKRSQSLRPSTAIG
jgi:hypothetical protein